MHIAIQSFFESCTVLDLSASCGGIFHCPITHYVKENFIWSALNTWALHFIELSFNLVLCSKVKRSDRYFFTRVFGILSYCVPSYLYPFWDKQISFLSISCCDSPCLCLHPYLLMLRLTFWPLLFSAGSFRACGGMPEENSALTGIKGEHFLHYSPNS